MRPTREGCIILHYTPYTGEKGKRNTPKHTASSGTQIQGNRRGITLRDMRRALGGAWEWRVCECDITHTSITYVTCLSELTVMIRVSCVCTCVTFLTELERVCRTIREGHSILTKNKLKQVCVCVRVRVCVCVRVLFN